MPDRQVSPAAVQATLIGAMAIWGLNVAAVKVLTGVFDPATVAVAFRERLTLMRRVGVLLGFVGVAAVVLARTAVFFYWVPAFGIGCAAMLLGERLNLWHLFGFLAVMGGTYLGTRQPATVSVVAP